MTREGVVVVCLALLIAGCAGVETPAGRGGSRTFRQRAASSSGVSSDRQHRGRAEGAHSEELDLSKEDSFEALLVRAGLEDLDAWPVRRNPFTPEDASEVLARLMEKPVTLSTFPPRMAAGFLLREVLEHGEVSREELVRRVARFAREQVAVL